MITKKMQDSWDFEFGRCFVRLPVSKFLLISGNPTPDSWKKYENQ